MLHSGRFKLFADVCNTFQWIKYQTMCGEQKKPGIYAILSECVLSDRGMTVTRAQTPEP